MTASEDGVTFAQCPATVSTMDHERRIVSIISARRQELGISYETMAARMRAHGSRVTGPGLYKTEKGRQPRKLTINDLIAAAQVLGIELADLMGEAVKIQTKTLEQLANRAVVECVKRYEQNRKRDEAVRAAVEALEDYLDSEPVPSDEELLTLSSVFRSVDKIEQKDMECRVGMACAKLRELLKETA